MRRRIELGKNMQFFASSIGYIFGYFRVLERTIMKNVAYTVPGSLALRLMSRSSRSTIRRMKKKPSFGFW